MKAKRDYSKNVLIRFTLAVANINKTDNVTWYNFRPRQKRQVCLSNLNRVIGLFLYQLELGQSF